MHTRIWIISTAVWLAATPAASSASSLTGIGFLAGGTNSYAFSISADGSTVVGSADSTAAGGQFRGIRRTSGGGLLSLGALANATSANATGASAGGQYYVGTCDTRVGFVQRNRAVRWTSAGAIQDLGLVSGDGGFPGGGGATESYAAKCNADGSVIVGYHYFPSFGNRACRWTAAGWQDLGALSSGAFSSAANGVSADGSIVVGWSQTNNPLSGPFAFRWTSAGMQSIGALPGGNSSSALAISADGNVIVGDSGSTDGRRAMRWTSSLGMLSLGTIPGLTDYSAQAVNADGSVIVGAASVVSTGALHAFVWTEGTGMLDLNTLLPSLGVNLTGWTLSSAVGISADGQTIVGFGNHNSTIEGWVATIPAPGMPLLLLGSGLCTARRRRS